MELINPQLAEEWITGLSAFDRDNEIILYCIFAAFGRPNSYLDVGSGTGAMVNMAEKVGIEIVNGMDILPRPAHPRLMQVDLRQYQRLPVRYDLVTSIETAEHIEPEYADTFIDTITTNASKRIVFTAAMPGQQGHGHVNCQPMEYWRTKFYDRGWNYYPPETWRLALLLSNAHHASHHVEANLSVFVPR